MSVAVTATFGRACTGMGTEKEYRNESRVSSEVYREHATILKDRIRKLIEKNEGPYYPSENDSLTEIIIDTVLYSPGKDRMAFFVITKNSDDKQLVPGNKNESHFSAHAFTAFLDGSRGIHHIFWINVFSEGDDADVKTASQAIRMMYFKGFRERRDNKGESIYKYNLDDVRFWNGPFWKG